MVSSRLLLDRGRAAFRVAGFGALTGSMLPLYLARRGLAHGPSRDEVQDAWVGRWCSTLLSIFGVSVDMLGERPRAAASSSGLLVVSNHRSTADILVLLGLFGGHMVSRADLARWPLIGSAARSVGTVFVDRSDALSGAATVRTIRTLLTRGRTVSVFPEGTTFADDEVRPFQTGAFVAALHSGARILPVGLAYAKGSGAAFVNESFPKHLARMAAADPSRMALAIGKPILVEEKARAAKLSTAAHQMVQSLVADARKHVDR
jgi:1-acyl-sn-glycerol-3-phosphate acyltransferase